MSRRLRTRHVAALAFAMTCAGPFGIEGAVQLAGPVYTVFCALILSAFFNFPQILVVAELSSIMPDNAGMVAWVHRAFGTGAAKICAVNVMFYLFIDLATYPVLLVEYVASAYGLGDYETIMKVVVILFGSGINLLRIHVVGDFLLWTSLALLIPFVVGICMSFGNIDVAIEQMYWTTPSFDDSSEFYSTIAWLNTGWDSMGSIAEETSIATFFAGMVCAMVMSIIVYSLSILGALTVGPGKWDAGYLAVAYGMIGGPLLGHAVTICAAFSNMLIYVSELATTCRCLAAMGESTEKKDEVICLPEWLSWRISSEAPYMSIAIISLISIVFAVFLDFAWLVQLSTLFHFAGYSMDLAAFLYLRRDPSNRAPFQIPGGWTVAVLVTLAQVAVMLPLSILSISKGFMLGVFVLCNLFAIVLPTRKTTDYSRISVLE